MATTSTHRDGDKPEEKHLTKKELQRQMAQTRESVSETVGEIKQTVSRQYEAARDTVAGVLNYREEFQKEPLVWSLGALSAGFALGYTMGYAHKETRDARKKSEVAAFTNSLVEELSLVGNSLVMPTLNARIRELFGFDFSEVLESIGHARNPPPKRKGGKRAIRKLAGKRGRAKSRK